jgi:hypothetical protein
MIRDSTALRAALEEKQTQAGKPVLQLVLDNDTRWHSQLSMLERFVEVFDSLHEVLLEADTGLHIDDNDLAQAVAIVSTLSHVRKVSRALESECTVTLSLVLPHLHKLVTTDLATSESDIPCNVAFKASLRAAINSRFSAVFNTVTIAAKASALDPRTAKLSMLPADLRDEVWRSLEMEAIDLLVNAAGNRSDIVRQSRPIIV